MIFKYSTETVNGTQVVEATQFTGILQFEQKFWLGKHWLSSNQEHKNLRIRCCTVRLSAKLQEAIAGDWLVKIDDNNIEVRHRYSFERDFTICKDSAGEPERVTLSVTKPIPRFIQDNEFTRDELLLLALQICEERTRIGGEISPFSASWKKADIVNFININLYYLFQEK